MNIYLAKILKYLLEKVEPKAKRDYSRLNVPPQYKVGRRVFINEKSGFSRGHYGVIRFIVVGRGEIWVERDRSSSVCYFWHDELDLVDPDMPKWA